MHARPTGAIRGDRDYYDVSNTEGIVKPEVGAVAVNSIVRKVRISEGASTICRQCIYLWIYLGTRGGP